MVALPLNPLRLFPRNAYPSSILIRITAYLVYLMLFPLNVSSEDLVEKLWETKCGVCHTMNPPPKLAPPVRGIVMNYQRKYSSRNSFSEAVADFVQSPSKEKSQMPHAIDTFNLMPPLPYDKKELTEIAGWMWDTIKNADKPPRSNSGQVAIAPVKKSAYLLFQK